MFCEQIEPSTSRVISEECTNEALLSPNDKQEATNAFEICRQILTNLNYLSATVGDKFSKNNYLMGEIMAKSVIKVLNEYEFQEDDEFFLSHEQSEESLVDEIITSSSSTINNNLSISSDELKSPLKKKSFIPIETKIKIVQVAKEHPNWSLQTLQRNGCSLLKSKKYLGRWENDILNGGVKECYDKINKWTYDRFYESRVNKQPVSTRMIQQWASVAAMQFENVSGFRFIASLSWVKKFKHTNNIRQRKVTRYIKSKKALDISLIMNEAESFQKRVSKLILNYDPNFVINTDQTGCEYRSEICRTLSHRGEKVTEVFLGDFNKVTHSYTAQYAITAAGTILPKVFLCMQEAKGEFGPRINESVNSLTRSYGNIYVTASKSGKLTKPHFNEFIKNILAPYCKSNEFLLIIDSWGGQTDPGHFKNNFTNTNGDCNANVEIIPPHCTPYCQPCDVYFFRQVKNFIKKIQNAVDVLQSDKQLSSREDVIKIHSLIHHQLSADIFKNMLSYAWYSAKLVSERSLFGNVNQICFPSDVWKFKCKCEKVAFIRCSICKKYLCFFCFYEKYHPFECKV